MQYGTEATIVDTASLAFADLSPENYRQELGRLADEQHAKLSRPVVRSKRRRAGKTPVIATRRPRMGRQVLIPGKRKAARHPWADRLHAARTAGFVVDQTHPDTNMIVGSCFACGHRFGFVYGDPVGQDLFEAEAERHKISPTGWRECTDGVAL